MIAFKFFRDYNWQTENPTCKGCALITRAYKKLTGMYTVSEELAAQAEADGAGERVTIHETPTPEPSAPKPRRTRVRIKDEPAE